VSAKRIQLRRTKGWRKPEGAIVVARPSRWGNPWVVVKDPDGGWKVEGNGLVYRGFTDKLGAIQGAVYGYRERLEHIRCFGTGMRFAYSDIRRELAGHDLACWCPLDQPCHADVLLEVANRATQ